MKNPCISKGLSLRRAYEVYEMDLNSTRSSHQTTSLHTTQKFLPRRRNHTIGREVQVLGDFEEIPAKNLFKTKKDAHSKSSSHDLNFNVSVLTVKQLL